MSQKTYETVPTEKTYTACELMEGYNSVQHGLNSMGWLAENHWPDSDYQMMLAATPHKFYGWYMHHIVSTIVMALCDGVLALRAHGVPVCESDYYTKELEQCEPTF